MNSHHRLTWRRCAPLALMAAGLLACPEPIPAPPDAGVAADTGGAQADVQLQQDAAPVDAGAAEAGASDASAGLADAGAPLDAGAAPDAATPSPDAGVEPPGCGQYVRFTLHGTVTAVEALDPTSVRIWQTRLVDRPVSVAVTYDATVADSRQQGDFGQYRQPGETTNMTIVMAAIQDNYTRPMSFFVEPFNDFQTQGDRLKLVSNYQLMGGVIAQAVVDFHDESETALDSVALPGAVPSLADYPQGATLRITRSSIGGLDPEAAQREACMRLQEGEPCRYANELGQCRDSRRGLICVSINAWPDRATISARIDRVEDQCLE